MITQFINLEESFIKTPQFHPNPMDPVLNIHTSVDDLLYQWILQELDRPDAKPSTQKLLKGISARSHCNPLGVATIK
jgi:hypothetical protein